MTVKVTGALTSRDWLIAYTNIPRRAEAMNSKFRLGRQHRPYKHSESRDCSLNVRQQNHQNFF